VVCVVITCCYDMPLGLYHFPIGFGDVLFVLGADCGSLSHLCDLVGNFGQVRGVVDAKSCSKELVTKMHKRYPNLWINRLEDGGQYQPSLESERLRDSRRLILLSSYGTSAFGILGRLPTRIDVLKNIYSYMGNFPLQPPISALIDLYPQNLPPVSPTNLIQYEQYLIRTVQPICTFYSTGCSSIGKPRVMTPSSSFWVIMAVPIQATAGCAASSIVTESDDSGDSDYCCERVFDILSSASTVCGESRASGIRPKEQLRLDPTYFPNTILLLSRYRKSSSVRSSGQRRIHASALMHSGVMSSSVSTPSLLTDIDDATVRRAFASLSHEVSPFEASPKEESFHRLPEEEIRQAARNVISSIANKTLSGPMAPSLCTIAETLLAATEPHPPPGFPPPERGHISSLLNFGTVPTNPAQSPIDPQLMFDLQQANQKPISRTSEY
jgi:hypothetical protein